MPARRFLVAVAACHRLAPRSSVVLAAACCALASGVGCAASDPCLDDEPAYEGAATDEAWRTMLDVRARATPGGDAATFTAPAPGTQILGSDGPATFSWTSPLQVAQLSSSTPSAGPSRHAHRSPLDAWSAWLIPSAHAHLPPVTGVLHLLELDVPARTCPVAALTTELTTTIHVEPWREIVQLAGSGSLDVTARLLSAYLTEGKVTEGPYAAQSITFQVAGDGT